MANVVRRKRAFENKWVLYELISKNPGICIYELAKKKDWTPGKVEHYVKKLLKDGMIDNSTEVVKGRNKRSLRAKKMEHFINWDKIKELKKPPNNSNN
ncbi:hypothetical protein LCGC14_0727400 [marine sediment metagenome]|uniref:Winged helix-turn-helix domain-containing protein n=1 Tax=marine sediment metagenome TaxID=412755 RepID=A0A0F9QAM8_9ZZZZ